jgi:hypothetical protein
LNFPFTNLLSLIHFEELAFNILIWSETEIAAGVIQKMHERGPSNHSQPKEMSHRSLRFPTYIGVSHRENFWL